MKDHNEFIMNAITQEFDRVLEYAEADQQCKRKSVGCAVLKIQPGVFVSVLRARNGVMGDCSDEVGNCGCIHAEQRAIVKILNRLRSEQYNVEPPYVLLSTYSPCTTCANLILESGLFMGVCYDIRTEHDLRGLHRLTSKMPVLTTEDINRKDKVTIDTLEQWQQDGSEG